MSKWVFAVCLSAKWIILQLYVGENRSAFRWDDYFILFLFFTCCFFFNCCFMLGKLCVDLEQESKQALSTWVLVQIYILSYLITTSYVVIFIYYAFNHVCMCLFCFVILLLFCFKISVGQRAPQSSCLSCWFVYIFADFK